jgi:hypothetical protein
MMNSSFGSSPKSSVYTYDAANEHKFNNNSAIAGKGLSVSTPFCLYVWKVQLDALWLISAKGKA